MMFSSNLIWDWIVPYVKSIFIYFKYVGFHEITFLYFEFVVNREIKSRKFQEENCLWLALKLSEET